MATATPEQMASWPAPNYINPSTQTHLVLGMEIPFIFLTVLVIAARFVSPMFTNKRSLGLDDWIMAFATVLSVAVGVINCYATKQGFGYHLWDFKNEWIEPASKAGFVEEVLLGPIVCSTKISILLFYQRIFPGDTFNKLVWVGIFATSLLGVVSLIVELLQVLPIQAAYDISIKPTASINNLAFLIFAAATNIVLDFYVFFLPLPPLLKLRIPRKQRTGIAIVFSLGLIVCIAGIIRLWYTTVFFKSYDIFWNSATVSIIATIEFNIGIICGSLPSIRPLLGKIFPKQLGSTKETGDEFRSSQPHSFPFQNLNTKDVFGP